MSSGGIATAVSASGFLRQCNALSSKFSLLSCLHIDFDDLIQEVCSVLTVGQEYKIEIMLVEHETSIGWVCDTILSLDRIFLVENENAPTEAVI